jgi:hypothetical protein
VEEDGTEVTGAATEDEEVPDSVIVGELLPSVEEDAQRISHATHEEPNHAARAQARK